MSLTAADKPSRKSRIVSTSLASDEILLELLQGKTNRIMALSNIAENSDHSNVAKAAKAVKGRVQANIEQIIRLKPDLVVATAYNRPEFLQALNRALVPFEVVDNFHRLQDIEANISRIGSWIGEPNLAVKLADSFRKDLERYRCILKGKTIINYSPNYGVYGSNTLFHSMVEWMGAQNIGAKYTEENQWLSINGELLLRTSPDYVIVPFNQKNVISIKSNLKTSPVWSNLKAVKEGRVIWVPTRELFAVSHHLVKAMGRIAKNILLTANKNTQLSQGQGIGK